MQLRFALLIALAFCFSNDIKAQTFEVPQNYVFKQKSDYAQYNAEVVKAVDWMVKTPSNQEDVKRQEVGTFLLAWMSGTPDVNIQINDAVTNLADQNPDMLLIYMGSYAKYAIENPSDKDKLKACKAAIKTVLYKYQTDKSSKKDKELDKLIKMDRGNKLDDWIVKTFAS